MSATRLAASSFIGVVSTLAVSGCLGFDDGDGSGNGPEGTLEQIEQAIASHCDGEITRGAPDVPAYARFSALADESTVIRCGQRQDNRTLFGRFATERERRTAVASIVLPADQVQQICVAGRDAYTVHFPDSAAMCKRIGDRIKLIVRPPDPEDLTHTFAANCGNTSYLQFKPRRWSAGCTGGSDNVQLTSWAVWNEHVAIGTGIASLRGPCHPNCNAKNALYEAKARIRLEQPKQCKNQGFTLRYFDRARFEVYMRPGNPFGEPVGWDENEYSAQPGLCAVSES